MKLASVSDYQELARKRLPRFLYDYIAGGSYAEHTLTRNIEDLKQVQFRQRVLRDVSSIDLSTEFFGRPAAMPVALGPIGLAGMNGRRGEIKAVRAAEHAGVPFTLSTVSVCPIAEVAAAAKEPFWFQLYMIRDRAFMKDLLAKAKEARCSALVFTVDMPMPGARYRDQHSSLAGAPGFAGAAHRFLQAAVKPRWAADVGLFGRPHTLGNVAPVLSGKSGLEDFLGWMKSNFDPSVTWKDLDFIRSEWSGPLVIKGILDKDDAKEAAALGADGIVVSNHGGRQLDGVPSTTRALPAIAEAVGDRLAVFADGGVRSGLDVARLIALGARGVLLGRAWAWALGADGEKGVRHMLGIIDAEMRIALALTGVTKISDLDSTALAR